MENLQLVKMRDCEISVIIPAYQAGDYLSYAIESVLNQTVQCWEVIIIDDGSTDNTSSVIRHYKASDKRIMSVTIPNSGMAAARKKGVSMARSQWIAFLDADDVWLPNKLEQQIPLMRSSNADVLIASGHYFGEVEKPWRIGSFTMNGEKLLRGLIRKNTIPLLSAIIKKNKIEEAEGFCLPRHYDIAADYDLWLKLCYRNCKFVSAGGDFVFKYRIHESQSTHVSKRHDTCKVVADLLKLHHHRGYINKTLYHSGVVGHFRELIDYELVNGNVQNIGPVLEELGRYVQIRTSANLIKWVAKKSNRMAQIVSWRMLSMYI